VRAAQDVSFEVPAGKLFTLLGPSGCGKTTTLRSIAGLEKPREGEISVGGALIYSSKNGVFIPPNRRGLGMVFQSYAIWPHMTVFENAAFPLQVSRSNQPERKSKRGCCGCSRRSRWRRWPGARRPSSPGDSSSASPSRARS
jgi:iron(III) transport system ATP-binding protein